MVTKAIGEADRQEDTQLLSPSRPAPNGNLSHQRPVSPAPSSRTVVDEIPHSTDSRLSFSRSRTEIAEVNLSWWERFKSLFQSADQFNTIVAKRVHIKGSGATNSEIFNNGQKSPFMLSVTVLSCPNADVEERQEGRCVLDTGCYQGNIISIDFANRLGYPSSTFLPLQREEESGGTVATGTIHTVLGAIYLTWYHSTSPKMFRNMRFLVSKTAQVDLLIGTHSIVRDGLIAPPNLMATPPKHYWGLNIKSNRKLEDLKADASDAETALEEAKKSRNEARISEADKKYRIAQLYVDLYKANASLKALDAEPAGKSGRWPFASKKQKDDGKTSSQPTQEQKDRRTSFTRVISDLESDLKALNGGEHHSGSESDP